MRRAIISFLFVLFTASAHAHDALTWRTLPPLPRALGGHFVGLSNDHLIVAGGSYWEGTPWDAGGRKVYADAIYALGHGESEWKEVGRLPHAVAHGAMVAIPSGLLCIGGEDAEKTYADVYLLEYSGGKIARRDFPQLPQAASKLAAAIQGQTVYVSGGQATRDATRALDSFYAMRLEGNSRARGGWQKLPSWPGPARIYHAMAASEDGIFIISGNAVTATPEVKQRRIFLLDVYRFEPEKGWSALPSLLDPVAAASVYAEKGRLIVFGGDTGFYAPRDAELRERHPGFTKDVMAYDAETRQWRKIGDFPTSLVTTGVVKWGGELVIAGGEDRPGHRSAMVLAVRLDDSIQNRKKR